MRVTDFVSCAVLVMKEKSKNDLDLKQCNFENCIFNIPSWHLCLCRKNHRTMCPAQRAQIRACHITGASRGWRLDSFQEIDYFTFFLIYLALAECKYLRRHANLTYLDLPVWILRFVLLRLGPLVDPA